MRRPKNSGSPLSSSMDTREIDRKFGGESFGKSDRKSLRDTKRERERLVVLSSFELANMEEQYKPGYILV